MVDAKQGVTNIRIFEYIRIFSDTNIRSYHIHIFFDTNIFGYSFVSFFGYEYIRIFVRIENLYSPHPGQTPQNHADMFVNTGQFFFAAIAITKLQEVR